MRLQDNANQVGGKRTHAQMTNARSDDELSDDEILNKIEEEAKGKGDNQIDVDKMTKRQRMAYYANQGETGG